MKLSELDGKYHIVQLGSVAIQASKSILSIEQQIKIFSNNKIHFHLYGGVNDNHRRVLEAYEVKYYPYFHYEGSLKPEEINKTIKKYDYASYLTSNTHKEWKKDLLIISAFGNKIYDYFKAGLPILCWNNMLATAQYIKEHGIGIIISRNQKNKLRTILNKNKKKYEEFIDNIYLLRNNYYQLIKKK